MVNFVGINRTQDASICVITGDGNVVAMQKERITRQKHHWGRPRDLSDFYLPRIPELREPVEAVVECYSSDAEFERRSDYLAELADKLGAPRVALINHHLAHAYSAFLPSGFSSAAMLVMDFMGSPATGEAPWRDRKRNRSASDVEVASAFVCRGGEIRLLEKQVWNSDRARPVSLGPFYFFLTQLFFDGDGHEGKVMGLASYGDPRRAALPPLRVEGLDVFIPDAWLDLFQRRSYRDALDRNSSRFAEAADVAAAGQQAFEDALLQVLRWLREATGETCLCFAGGVALNCVANGRLLREGGFERVFVPSAPSDAGTSIGCAIYAARHANTLDAIDWSTDYLGTRDDLAFDDALFDGFAIEEPSDLTAALATKLAQGKAFAVFQNRSEFGPRALGHRSIIADPRPREMRDFLNFKVKGREWFRPLAPIVRQEEVATYFRDVEASPFMQFAAEVREEQRERIPAVTHVDGTARLQTVAKQQDAFIWNLLGAFEERTGTGVLLNTSLNGPAEPIVQTVREAVSFVRNVPLDGIVVPPRLYRKQ